MQILLTKTDSSLFGENYAACFQEYQQQGAHHQCAELLLIPVKNLSDCDDSQVMNQVLESNSNSFDIHHAGTQPCGF